MIRLGEQMAKSAVQAPPLVGHGKQLFSDDTARLSATSKQIYLAFVRVHLPKLEPMYWQRLRLRSSPRLIASGVEALIEAVCTKYGRAEMLC